MAKTKRKRIVKPKEGKVDKQEMDGLNVSFEEAMRVLSQPVKSTPKEKGGQETHG